MIYQGDIYFAILMFAKLLSSLITKVELWDRGFLDIHLLQKNNGIND